jgi:hypothetical protein
MAGFNSLAQDNAPTMPNIVIDPNDMDNVVAFILRLKE